MYNTPHVSGSFVPHGYSGPGNHPPQPCPPPYITSRATAPATTGRGVPWSSGLFKCRNDPANCIVTAICPCVTFGQIAEIVNRGELSCCVSGTIYALFLGLTGLSCMYSCFFRSRLRGQYDLEESPVDDCLVHFCCETCALCQEYRELKNRGFDMGIGWQANMNRNNRGITMPPVAPGMTR